MLVQHLQSVLWYTDVFIEQPYQKLIKEKSILSGKVSLPVCALPFNAGMQPLLKPYSLQGLVFCAEQGKT